METALDIGEMKTIISPCTPRGCGDFVQKVVEQVVSAGAAGSSARCTSVGLEAALRLFEGLAPEHSIESILPRAALKTLGVMVDYAQNIRDGKCGPLPPFQPDFQLLAPEVHKLVSTELIGVHLYANGRSTADNELHDALMSFFRGLIRQVEHVSVQDVAPPPFENISRSYNPGARGVALYFTDDGEQGRWPRRYDKRDKRGKKEEGGGCKKGFPSRKKRTGGVFRYGYPPSLLSVPSI